MDKEHTVILNQDEKELLDILISAGVEKILGMARKETENKEDVDSFLRLAIEIQCLLMKLGYDFKFEIKEIRKL